MRRRPAGPAYEVYEEAEFFRGDLTARTDDEPPGNPAEAVRRAPGCSLARAVAVYSLLLAAALAVGVTVLRWGANGGHVGSAPAPGRVSTLSAASTRSARAAISRGATELHRAAPRRRDGTRGIFARRARERRRPPLGVRGRIPKLTGRRASPPRRVREVNARRPTAVPASPAARAARALPHVAHDPGMSEFGFER